MSLIIFLMSSFLYSNSFINMTSDYIPLKVGDTLVVEIIENTKAGHSSQKEISNSSDMKGDFKGNLMGFIPTYSYSMNEKGSSDSKGEGSIESSSFFVGRVNAVVKEILDNGNFKIEAKQIVNINDEEKNLELSGIVNPIDIKNGSILSSNIYDLNLIYKNKGVIAKRQKRSLLNFLFGWIF
jgi:flagellar L-ring protein precursor FlgH